MSEPTIHATALSVAGRGVLISGPSGSGKTQLALTLVRRARHAGFASGIIADDQTVIQRHGQQLRASAPTALDGLVEIRGFGVVSLGDGQSPAAGLALHVALVETGAVRMHEDKTWIFDEIELPSLQLPIRSLDSAASAVFAALGLPVWL